jgi:heptosyltransferase-1
MGDIVMATPIVAALRSRYPDAFLAWLVQAQFADLLTAHPGLDDVIVWDRSEWGRLLQAHRYGRLTARIAALRSELRGHRFDLVLDLQGLLKSAVFARFTGAKSRIGLDSREGSGLLMTETARSDEADPLLIGSEYRHMATHLGLASNPFGMTIGVSPDAQRAAADILTRVGGPYAVICPFTTRPQKHWRDDHWVKLAERLHSEHDLAVVMLGAPGDRERARQIADSSVICNLVGETGLQEAAEIVRRSRCLIGVDTGLTHMGTAFRIPTVAIFGSTCPYLRTDSPDTSVIFHNLPCAPCKRRPTCGGAYDCMAGITPEEVLQPLRRHLEPG